MLVQEPTIATMSSHKTEYTDAVVSTGAIEAGTPIVAWGARTLVRVCKNMYHL